MTSSWFTQYSSLAAENSSAPSRALRSRPTIPLVMVCQDLTLRVRHEHVRLAVDALGAVVVCKSGLQPLVVIAVCDGFDLYAVLVCRGAYEGRRVRGLGLRGRGRLGGEEGDGHGHEGNGDYRVGDERRGFGVSCFSLGCDGSGCLPCGVAALVSGLLVDPGVVRPVADDGRVYGFNALDVPRILGCPTVRVGRGCAARVIHVDLQPDGDDPRFGDLGREAARRTRCRRTGVGGTDQRPEGRSAYLVFLLYPTRAWFLTNNFLSA